MLVFYQDSRLPIDRYDCLGCGSHGDLLDLIAVTQNVKRNLATKQLTILNPEIGNHYTAIAADIEYNRVIANKATEAWQFFQGDRASAVHNSVANTVLKPLLTEIRSSLSWTEDAVKPLLGFAQPEDFESWMRLKSPLDRNQAINRNHFKYVPSSITGALVVPIRITPDVIEGFQVYYLHENRLKSKIAWFDYTGKSVKSGLIGHPDILRSRDGVIVFDSPQVALKVQLDNVLRTERPLPILAVAGAEEEHISDNLQLIAKRNCIFWTPKLRSNIVRRAAHLDAKLTPVGHSRSDRLAWINKSGPEQLLKRINDTATHWATTLANVINVRGLDYGVEAIQAARLSTVEINQVFRHIRPELLESLQAAVQPSWPYKRISVKTGCVEQRSSSWWYVRGDQETLITDAPFRILQIENDSRNQCWYLLEVSLAGNKHRIRVPRASLRRSPMDAIQGKLLAVGAGASTFDRSWEQQAMHISHQMYPQTQLQESVPVGINFSKNALQLTNVVVDLNTGCLTKSQSATSGSLLPLADGDVINPAHIRELAGDWFTCRAVLAVALQWICEIRGTKLPLVPLTTVSQIKAGKQFLADIGAITQSLPDYRDTYRVLRHIDSSSISKDLAPDCRWISCTKPASLYYGGLRTIIDLGEPSERPNLSPKHIQEVILGLVSVYLRRFSNERDSHTALVKAWTLCLRKTGITPGHDTAYFPVRTIDKTVEQLINEGIRTELWKVHSRKPGRPDLCDVWLDRDKDLMTFTKSSINYTLTAWKLPRWDMIDVLSQLMTAPDFFRQMVRVRSRDCLQVLTHGIDLTARKEARRRVKNA